jgi:tetratricopeptide (TPR) repeat protein
MKFKRMKYALLLLVSTMLLGACSGKSAGSYYKEGLEYFNNGNYEKAEASFSKALQLNADRAEYYIDYAMSLIQLGKYEEAINYLDQAILDNDNSIVRKNNKLAYRGKGIAYYKAHDYKAAIKQFDKALAINESSDLNMDILYYKGNAQEKAGLYEKAVDTYSLIIKNKTSDAATYNHRAYAYRLLGNYEKSLEDYNKAIKLDSRNYDYYFEKYFLLIDSGDKDSAATVLDQASKITGSTQEDKFNIAKVHYFQGNYDQAVSELSEAFRNGFAEAYYYLGNIYEKKEDYKNASYNYSMYIKEDGNIDSAAVYNQISVCLMKQGKYDEALSYVQSGLKYNDVSYNQALWHNEIVCYENLSEFKKAYDSMKDYLAKYPDDKEAAKENDFLKTRLPEASTVK